MHIAEGFLPVAHCVAWSVAALPPSAASIRLISKRMDRNREDRVLLAASAAFLFTLSALRLPSITGSSSHPTGIAVGTYLFGPSVMPAMALITLTFQALLLAHGGLTTLGANVFSLGVVGPWTMWLALRGFQQLGWSRARSIFVSTVVANVATYATTAAELALAYPSAEGGYAASLVKFLGVFLVTQIPIGIAEGLVTVALLRNLATNDSVALEGARASAPLRPTVADMMALIAMFSALIGGLLYANHTKPPGTDDRAVATIQALHPTYIRFARPVFEPGTKTEEILFMLQAGAGLAVLGWTVVRLRARRTKKPRSSSPFARVQTHPHLSDIAFTNAWRYRNPWEKALFGGGFLVVSLLVPPFPGCAVIAGLVALAAIGGARIPVLSWLSVLLVPVTFAFLTAAGILLQFDTSGGTPLLSLDWQGLPFAAGLLMRSVAAISCLAFVGWTTPLMELLPLLQKLGVPHVMIDLALMVYRFLFVSSITVTEMRRAQSWRLGKADYGCRVRALSMLASGLFIRCVQRARRLEAGMESRGYSGRLWVLAPRHAPSVVVIVGTLAVQAGVLVAAWVLK